MKVKNIYLKRILPHLSLIFATSIFLLFANIVTNEDIKNILLSITANGFFFFVAYLFYDVIKSLIFQSETRYIHMYVKQKIALDVFASLYFFKKVLYSYNLDSNTFENIINIINLEKNEIKNNIKSQTYTGFQIFKNTSEVSELFHNAAKDNIFLKFLSHLDAVDILKISNNVKKIEVIYKNHANFKNVAEKAIEFTVVDGRSINKNNSDRMLLLKKTQIKDRYVVYDSGIFSGNDKEKLLNRYLINDNAAHEISELIYETFTLMKYWLPKEKDIDFDNIRFRKTQKYYCERTNLDNMCLSDIIDKK